MPFDLATVQLAVSVVIGVLTILGTLFGWFGKATSWFAARLKGTHPSGLIDIPPKTMILLPVARQNAVWWHMGSMGGNPAMQIVGDLNITNISKHDVVVTGARLKKPKAIGHAFVRAQGANIYSSNHPIPVGGISDLRFDFFVQPPVKEKGEMFKADVAILDQFGNEHWLRGLEFPYT